MISTIEIFQNKETALAELAKFNQTALESFTLKHLRTISKEVVKDNAKYKKADLIALILEATATYERGSLLELKKEIGDSVVADDFISLIKNYFKNGKSPIALAEKLKKALQVKPDKDGSYPLELPSHYKSENGEGFSLSTLGKTKIQELRSAVKLVKCELPNSEEFCNSFYNELYFGYLKLVEKIVNSQYSDKINQVKTTSDKIKLNGQSILAWAVATIETAANNGQEITRGWYPLSLALAVTSGRRMDEIHGETIHIDKGVNRYYELRDNNQIFISQLAKNPEHTSFVFSPLVNAETWLKAYDCLPDTAVNLPEDKVNKIISSNIGKSPLMKKLYQELGLSCYKDSRDFYIVYRLNEYKAGKFPQFDRESDFVQFVIGHSSKNSGHSYEKFIVE